MMIMSESVMTIKIMMIMMISMACQTSHHCQETWKLRCHESAAAPGPFHKMWMLLSFIRFDFLMIRLLIYCFWSIYLFFELLSLYCCKCVSLQEKLKPHTSKSTFSCQHSSAKNKKYIFVCHMCSIRYYLCDDRDYVDLRVESQHNFNVKWPV